MKNSLTLPCDFENASFSIGSLINNDEIENQITIKISRR